MAIGRFEKGNRREPPEKESWEKVNFPFKDLLRKLDFSLLATSIIAVRLLCVIFNPILMSSEEYH